MDESAATATRPAARPAAGDRKSTRLNSSHLVISYAVFCLKKKKKTSLPRRTVLTHHAVISHIIYRMVLRPELILPSWPLRGPAVTTFHPLSPSSTPPHTPD